jgi:hypothetical protein
MFAAAGCVAQVHHADIGVMASADFEGPFRYYESERGLSGGLSPSVGAYMALPLSPVILFENEIQYSWLSFKMTENPRLAVTQHITCMVDAAMLKFHSKRVAGIAGFKLLKTIRSVRQEKGPSGIQTYNQIADFRPLLISGLCGLEYAFSHGCNLYLHWSGSFNGNALKHGARKYYDDNSAYLIESFQIGIKKRLYRWRNPKYYHVKGRPDYY